MAVGLGGTRGGTRVCASGEVDCVADGDAGASGRGTGEEEEGSCSAELDASSVALGTSECGDSDPLEKDVPEGREGDEVEALIEGAKTARLGSLVEAARSGTGGGALSAARIISPGVTEVEEED